MKKTANLLPIALSVAALATACTSGQSTDDRFAVATDSIVDTLRLKAPHSRIASTFRFVADLPTADSRHKAAVDSALTAFIAGGVKVHSLGDVKAAMRELADTFKRDTQDWGPAGEPPTTMPNMSDATLKLVYQTPEFATFGLTGYVYYGGAAHGSSTERHLTVDLSDGHGLAWDDIFTAEGKQRLVEMLKDALRKQYYKDSTPAFDGPSDGVFSFALPANLPAFMEDGIVFNWAEYEIDAYAAGRPSCILPYAAVKPLLTPRALTLLKSVYSPEAAR